MRQVLAGLCVAVPTGIAVPLAAQTARTQEISAYSEAVEGSLEGGAADGVQKHILPFFVKKPVFRVAGAK